MIRSYDCWTNRRRKNNLLWNSSRRNDKIKKTKELIRWSILNCKERSVKSKECDHGRVVWWSKCNDIRMDRWTCIKNNVSSSIRRRGGLNMGCVWWSCRCTLDWKYEYSIRWQYDTLSCQRSKNQTLNLNENVVWSNGSCSCFTCHCFSMWNGLYDSRRFRMETFCIILDSKNLSRWCTSWWYF